MGVLQFKSNDQMLEDEKRAKELEAALEMPEASIDSLSSYLEGCWTEAQTEKTPYEEQLLKNLRQINGQYEAEKLEAIKRVGGSDAYMLITDMKCRTAEAWLKEILFGSGKLPYDIEPTPVADLPKDITTQVTTEIFQTAMETAMFETFATGGKIDPRETYAEIIDMMPDLLDMARKNLQKQAQETAEKMKLKMDDQLTEGNFRRALTDAIPDIVLGTGIIKGPLTRKRKQRKVERDPKTKRLKKVITEQLIEEFECRSPFDIFPAPGALDFDEGYLFDRIKMTPRDLQELIGVPGYREDEIRKVLSEYGEGIITSNWTDLQVDRDLESIKTDEETSVNTSVSDSEKIDVLNFWGTVQGKMLREWGMSESEVPDEEFFYDIYAYYIKGHVICARLNPGGEKPYSKVSYVRRKNSFWGTGLPETIADIQAVCNACIRAIVNNIGFASGPMVERNVDRVPKEAIEDDIIYPLKVWDVTADQMMSSAPALKFYQPQMVVEKILSVLNRCLQMADEHCGIPSYAHGDPAIGGAGRTASGLQMLMAGASRGIKNVIYDIDTFVIEPTIERLYYKNIEKFEYYSLLCDYRIQAKGSAALVAKEQKEVRQLEFFKAINNPIDMQIIGMGGRKYLLSEMAEQMGVDMSKLEKEQQKMAPPPGQPPPPEAVGQQGPGGPPQPASQRLDAAGNPVQGQDMRPNYGGNMNMGAM